MRAHGGDALSVVEAAYRFDPPTEDWLRGVLEAMRPFVDQGFGAWGFVFDGQGFLDGKLAYQCPTAVGLPPDWLEGLRATLSITSRDSQVMYETIFGTPYHTMSEILEAHPTLLGAATGAIAIPGVMDSVGVSARDPGGTGIFIGAHAGRRMRLDGQEKERLGRMAAHLATAFRLRSRLGAGGAGAVSLQRDAEALLRPDGRLEHATGAATERGNMNALREAAIAADRATRELRHQDSDSALLAWEALVAGRWSLIATYENDGRKLLVAQPNEPAPLGDDARLTTRERQIAGYLLLGHPQKLIGYELGLSEGTVSTLVSRIRSKLGVDSLSDLLMAIEALRRRGRLE